MCGQLPDRLGVAGDESFPRRACVGSGRHRDDEVDVPAVQVRRHRVALNAAQPPLRVAASPNEQPPLRRATTRHPWSCAMGCTAASHCSAWESPTTTTVAVAPSGGSSWRAGRAESSVGPAARRRAGSEANSAQCRRRGEPVLHPHRRHRRPRPGRAARRGSPVTTAPARARAPLGARVEPGIRPPPAARRRAPCPAPAPPSATGRAAPRAGHARAARPRGTAPRRGRATRRRRRRRRRTRRGARPRSPATARAPASARGTTA